MKSSPSKNYTFFLIKRKQGLISRINEEKLWYKKARASSLRNSKEERDLKQTSNYLNPASRKTQTVSKNHFCLLFFSIFSLGSSIYKHMKKSEKR